MTLNAPQLELALRRTAERLSAAGIDGPIRLYLVGGSAALLSGLLHARTTAGVDVTAVDPDRAWADVRDAARAAAEELELPDSWLNDKCRIYAWRLPLGWLQRCARARAFGPLELWPLSRRDLVAAKIVSAPTRPHDLEDLRAIGPTDAELDFAEQNIDRLEREHLDPDKSFDDCRAILNALRGAT